MFINEFCAFDPIHTFECGQCFRWNCDENGVYTGISGDKLCKVNGRELTFNDEDAEFWCNYFSFDTDYNEIQKNLILKDDKIEPCINFGNGIRILKQDLWECIISFIISANNNIPRIKKIIETMCELFGNKCCFADTIYYTFPTAERLSMLSREDLAPLRAGYRDAYILEAAQKVANGDINLDALFNMSDEEARFELMKIKGIGRKVADCILLFSLSRFSVFPTDVWIKRILSEVYGVNDKDIPTFVTDKYGEYAGFAQQYLFYYYRSHN